MAKLFYIARDKTGRKVSGSEDVVNREELISRLQARDLFVIDIPSPQGGQEQGQPGAEPSVKSKRQFKHYHISGGDMVLFCRQLATLLGAGITILQCLNIISRQVASRRLYKVIQSLEKNMEAGLSFHQALAKHPAVFSELWINLVESGEASGNLAVVLSRLAAYLERVAAFKAKIISALIYPIILFVVGTGALLFLTIKIIPTFAELFKGFGVKLPMLTQILINISSLIRSYILLLIGAAIAGFFLLKNYIRSDTGRRHYENLKFGLPVFGEFFRAMIVERFSSEMSTLIESGVPILYALEISEHSVGNLTMSDIIRKIKEEVRQGRTLNKPLEESNFFEPMVTQMVGIGEEIGELPQMFKRINSFYQDLVETYLSRMTAMFEPLMLVFMGVVIGIMVIGMFLPIFQIAQIGSPGGG